LFSKDVSKIAARDRIYLGATRQTQPPETSLTELAGRLRNDSRRIADRVELGSPLPQIKSPPLRPTARHPERRPAKPI
jgi:cell division protein FtsZ